MDYADFDLYANYALQMLKGKLDTYQPPSEIGTRWKYWKTRLDPKVCEDCRLLHGKIYASEEKVAKFPMHYFCRCEIVPMRAVRAGNATKDGVNGADYWMMFFQRLPEYYITETELRALGWKNGKSPVKYAPGKMLTLGVYENENGHLPDAPGRIWFECDINYYQGKRNGHRLLYSNDGLLFATYDH